MTTIAARPRLAFFERYLSLWVALCMVGGIATVVGVLVEVPVMLSVCAACHRAGQWFPRPEAACSES